MYIEVKHPFAYLRKGDGNVLFVDDLDDILQGEGNSVVSIDNIPDNYPRFGIATHPYHKAIERVKEMVMNEGWELVETSVNELKELID